MYETGNPVPSAALEDVADNAQTLDALVTKTDGTTTDRLGNTRRVFQQILMDMGFQPLSGSFQTGATITARNQALYDEVSQVFYAWGGTIPVGGYIVPAGSTPTTAGGIGAGAWSDKTDLMLRSELFSAQNASTLIGGLTLQTLTTAQAKATTFKDGDKVHISDVGNTFTYKSSRYLIAGQSQSEITFDDVLHILVTAGGMLQFDDFGKAKQKQTQNYARFAAKLKDRTSAITLDCYGDSITFGQALADTANATNKIGAATGFGDGSTHDHWQFNNNYPQWIASFLADNIYQSSSVNNFGYSGDRTITGYLRHQVLTSSDAATIMYGVNDCLFATSNGSVPQGLSAVGMYSVENYATALRLFAAKQIMQGKYVTILGTAPFASLSGHDGSQLAASKLTRAYNAAAKRVADEFGCRFIDVCQDMFTQYGIMEITQEGTHLGEDGLKIVGERISASLVTVDTENRVSHGSVLIANPNLSCILTRDAANVLPNSTSTTPRGTVDNSRTTMSVSTNWITVPFFAETDNIVAFLNGSCSAAGATFDLRLDNGALQSDFHFQNAYFSGKPTSQKQITKGASFSRAITNISDDTQPFLHVANRGWHYISIRKSSGSGGLLFDSLSFLSVDSLIASDINGVTASCSVSSASLDSGAINISTVSQDYPGEFGILFTNPMVSNKFTAIVDVNETASDPITITTRYKTTGGVGVAFNKWNGTAWVKFAPTMFTVKVIGGR